jgi:Zn-dependent protease with chaperone function
MPIPSKTVRTRVVALAAVLSLIGGPLAAQTQVKLPSNKYTPQQDVELGRKAAAEVRQQYPIIEDEAITRYLDRLGDRLVENAPSELKHPAYEYSFTPVNLKEINAFALPGGPMFVHRGMIEAAATEGEVVGVMAHELAHVLLRHGTANASKAQNPWLQLGQIAGVVGGAIVGGAAGSAIAQGSQFGLGTLLLKYSRDFEKQADLMGAQIMARAGYDPRSLARMFETIEKQSKGSGGPQWMSSHPNPGNRTSYITKEAEQLPIAGAANMSGFEPTKSRLAELGPAKSMADLGKGGGGSPPRVGKVGEPVPAPSGEYRSFNAGVLRAAVPSNWQGLQSNNAVKFVPQNGYGDYKGSTVFTHGVEFGVMRASSQNLQQATNIWLEAIGRSNPELRLAGKQSNVRLSQRAGLATPLTNPSPLGGQERITIYTTFLADGNLFYYLTVVPDKEAEGYGQTFQRVGQSIQLTDQ